MRKALALLLCVLVLAACQIRVDTNIQVDDDGSGSIDVAVGLDADAVRRTTDLDSLLETDDLTKAGWQVTGPAKEADGYTRVHAQHDFATPAEADHLLAQISGPNGPFRKFHLDREESFSKINTTFDGTVDFQRGLEAFTDKDLAKALDGKPLGRSVEAIEKKLGQTLDKVFIFQVAIRMPGTVTSNAPTAAANGAVWRPKLSSSHPVDLHAAAEKTKTRSLVLIGIGSLAGLVALLLVLVWIASWRSNRSRPA